MSKVAIYGAGGAGINIARQIFLRVEQDQMAPYGIQAPDIFFVDTSESNMRKPGIDTNHVFLFEGVDGSGKVRAENHALITKSTLKILQAFKPGDFNIVICSAAGGSGSVIGHSLVAELKKQGQQVIMILITSVASHIEIENSLKSLKSLDALAGKIHQPIAVHYLENSTVRSRQETDADAVGAGLMLLGLFGARHEEMDSADLRNWLSHPSLGAEAVSLQICRNQQQYDACNDVLTVATLATETMNTTLEPTPAYQAVGFVPEGWKKGLIQEQPINFALTPEVVEQAAATLNVKLRDVNSVLSARVKRDSLVNRDDDVTDDGMIL